MRPTVTNKAGPVPRRTEVGTPARDMQRACACGNHIRTFQEECDTCRADRQKQPRAAIRPNFIPPFEGSQQEGPTLVSPHKLASSGQADSFARVRTVIHIQQDHLDEVEAILHLVELLASQLGLKEGDFQVRIDGEAAGRVGENGRSGQMEEGVVYLHPRRFDPERADGRALLSHEMVHLHQRQHAADADALSPLLAEQEARSIAAAVAAGQRAHVPKESLFSTAVAADTGVQAEAPAMPMAQAVRSSRARELSRIRDLLDTGIFDWFVTDGDVRAILSILATMPFFTARAVVAILERDQRVTLVDNITPSAHFRDFRPQVLACYRALEAEDVARFNENLLKNMHLANLSPEELDSVLYVLNHLQPLSLRELVREDSPAKDAIRQIMANPQLSEEQSRQLAASSEAAQRAEAQTASEIQQRSDQYANDQGVQELIRFSIENIGRPGQVIERLSTVLDEDRLRYIAGKLDEQNKLDPLIENTPEEIRYQAGPQQTTYLRLVSFRPMYKNVELAERLLSTGIFDWSVNPAEARFAYLLIRSLPLDARERFRRYDQGRWLRALEGALSPEMFSSGEYAGLEVRRRGGEMVDAAAEVEARLSRDESHVIEDLERRCRAGITRETAPDIYRRLILVHEAEPQPGPNGSLSLLEAIARRLDRQGFIERLFNALDESLILSEAYRAGTLRIFLSRDSIHVQNHARQLLDRGFLSLGQITATEAYLAYQLVRALPDEERERFYRENPGLQATITEEMTDQMLSSSSMNAFVERTTGGPQTNVRAQIMSAALWRGQNATRLRTLVNMAIAMGDHRLVFEQSQRFRAYSDSGLLGIVRDFHLYNPDDPSAREYHPENFEPGQHGVLEWLANAGDWIVSVSKVLGSLIVSNQVNVNDIGGLSESVRSIRFAEQRRASEPTTAGGRREVVTNQLTIFPDIENKHVRIELPRLEIDSFNLHQDGQNIQSGRIAISGVNVNAWFVDEDLRQLRSFSLEFGGLNLVDFLLIRSNSMVGISLITLENLHLAGDNRTMVLAEEVPFGRTIAVVPILPAVFRFLYSLYATYGAYDRQLSIPDLDVSFSRLNVQGININGSQEIGSVQVTDFSLGFGRTRTAYVQRLIASLSRRLQRVTEQARTTGQTPDTRALQQRIEAANTELVLLERDEPHYLDLERRDRQMPEELTPAERAELGRLRQRYQSGAVIDIGSVQVTGLSGQFNADDITARDLQGEGENIDLTMLMGPGMLSAQQAAYRFTTRGTPDPAQVPHDPLGGPFRLEIGSLSTGRLEIMQSIPSSTELNEQLRQLEPMRGQSERSYEIHALEGLRDQVVRYEQLAVRDPNSLTHPEQDEFARIREDLTSRVRLRAGRVELEGTTLDLNQAREAAVSARRVQISGVEMPGSGLSVGSITGTDVSAGIQGRQGIPLLESLTGASASPTVHAGQLTISQARWAINEAALRDELQTLEAMPESSRSAANRERLSGLQNWVSAIEDLRGRIHNAEAAVASAATDRQHWDRQRDLDFLRQTLDVYMNRMGAETLEFRGLNARMDLSATFAAAGQTVSGMTVEGTGQGGRLFDQLTLTGFARRDPLRPGRELAIGSLNLGPTSGRIGLSSSGVRADDVLIERLQMDRFFFQSNTMQIGGNSSIVVMNSVLTGSIRLEEAMTVYDVEEWRIESITGEHIAYVDRRNNLDITLQSGTVRDITVSGFHMEMPESEAGRNRITSGNIHVGSAQNVDLQAAWLNGVQRARGRVDAQNLDVAILNDGEADIDLESLRLRGGRITGAGLDLEINAAARGVHAQLREGRQRVAVDELSGSAEGHYSGNFGTVEGRLELERAAGNVVRTENAVELEAMYLPVVTAPRLSFSSPGSALSSLRLGQTTLRDVTASAVFEFDPPNPRRRDSEEAGLRRIVIRNFDIPIVEVDGLSATVDAGGYTTYISLPMGNQGRIEGLRLTPQNEGGEGFIIERGGPGVQMAGWGAQGRAGIRGIDLHRLTANAWQQSGGQYFGGTTDLRVSGLTVDLLHDGRVPLHLDSLNLDRLEAQGSGRTLFNISRSGTGPTSPSLALGGVNAVLDPSRRGPAMLESASVDTLDLTGVQVGFPGSGITVDIGRARLPAGARYVRGERMTIPSFLITDASFQIDDIMALVSSSSSSASSSASSLSLADYNFLDQLYGFLNFDIYLPVDYLRVFQDTFPIRLLISQGRVNLETLVSSLGGTIDEFFDVEVRDNQMVLEFDPRRAGAMLGLGGLFGGSLARTDLAWWNLPDTELPAARRGWLRLPRLPQTRVNPQLTSPSSGGAASASPGPLPAASSVDWGAMELRNVDGRLNLFGENTINLNPRGRIHLGAPGGDSISELRLSGSTQHGRRLHFSMEHGVAALEDLVLFDTTINTGRIDVHELSIDLMTFGGIPPGFTTQLGILPRTVRGRIQRASALDIDLVLPPIPEQQPAGTP